MDALDQFDERILVFVDINAGRDIIGADINNDQISSWVSRKVPRWRILKVCCKIRSVSYFPQGIVITP